MIYINAPCHLIISIKREIYTEIHIRYTLHRKKGTRCYLFTIQSNSVLSV